MRYCLAVSALALVAILAAPRAETLAQDYTREVDIVPSEEDIGEGYQTPAVQRPLPKAAWWDIVDSAALAVALALAVWIALKLRSRNGTVILTIACLAYFGFYREGCICPIGAIQNVAVALVDPSYVIPYVAIVFFFLPLILALLLGRAFCGGPCPLGGIQDLVLLKPVEVPGKLDKALGLFKYVYLILAVWFAVQPAVDRDFIICRFDPFVGFFRLTGSGWMMLTGAALLLGGMFVGRIYCRYLCPYGALLSMLSRLARWGVSTTPDKELDCGLCVASCPFGAIENMRAVKATCLHCSRCYSTCPREPANQPQDKVATPPATDSL